MSRRQIVSTRSTAHLAPVLWRYDSGAPAFGIFVDGRHCMVGNEHGVITMLDHDAQVRGQVRLPDGVSASSPTTPGSMPAAMTATSTTSPARCPGGLRDRPEIDIYWLDIHDGVLGVSDADGGITAVDHEDEFLWRRPGRGARPGWCGATTTPSTTATRRVTGYEWRTGRELWHTRTGPVLFGWQEHDSVFAGTSTREVVRLSKTGRLDRSYLCDAPVFSCATAEGGRYVFAGDSQSSIYCFDAAGTRLWKLSTGCGSAYSMQYHDDRLYVVTTGGHLACIDASEPAIRAAQVGEVPQVRDVRSRARHRTRRSRCSSR
ncbi:PQQ-binding-like beta-propeller repeat protein [Micromonospora sp. M12]